MIHLRSSPLYRGVFAVALTAVALLISLLFKPVLEPNFFSLFLAAVLLSAWYHGLSGGLLATALSTLTILFFLLPPVFSVTIPDLNIFLRVASFALVALVVTWLTAAWRSSKGLLAATLASISDGVIATDRHGRITFMNSVAQTLTGWRHTNAKGKHLPVVLRMVHDTTRETVEDPVVKAVRTGNTVVLPEHTVLISKDGVEIPIEDSAAPIRDHNGKLKGVILVFRDMTGRRQLEERLSQSQRMDAVGRLAEGVAGDFNNLLTVITGYSELLRVEISPAGHLRNFADEIVHAAERAAALTRQLLAFSRGSTTDAKPLDLNATLINMEPMLKRMLGESIELIVLPGPGLARVKSDPSQVEQVVLHLASNARDAMPNGGKFVLETANVDLEDAEASKKVGVPPGVYVMLAASDTGIGMDAETRARLFEPFFTTKADGKSSGLGLSLVYGIVRQCEGQITVYSQVGCGSIFEIYFPRVTEPATAPPTRTMVASKGSETILVVDDEDGVRKLIRTVLESCGYSILEAGSGSAALSAYEKNAHKIDLVVADLVMPQMSGLELAEQLAGKKPDVKVLYVSGYRDSPVGFREGDPHRGFLRKPFTPDTLQAKVREILDARPAS